MKRLTGLSLVLSGLVFLYFLSFPGWTQAKQGCCSWHGGVAGCDTSVGRQVCNDGTYSPSCTCPYISKTPTPTRVLTPTPTPKPTYTQTPTPTSQTVITASPTNPPSPSPEVKGETTNGGSATNWLVGAGIGSFVLWRLIKWIDSKAPDSKTT